MYEVLIAHLRECAKLDASNSTYAEAADAIEELQKRIPKSPHGRLIDADALDDAFTDLRWENGDYKSGALMHWGDRSHWCLVGGEVENLINAAPTIIPAKEVE